MLRRALIITVVVGIGSLAALAVNAIIAPPAPPGSAGVLAVDFRDTVTADEGIGVVADTRPVLRIAVGAMISPRKTRHLYDEFLQVIAERVDRRAVFQQRMTYAQVNTMIERREVDLAFVCSGPYVTGKAEFGMEILAVPVAHGKSVYYSYLLAHKDSELTSIDGLQGKRFAFTDPHSNTGCLVPKYMLAEKGQNCRTFFADTYYTYSHDNSIRAVAEGVADGAAVDSLIWEFLQATDPVHTAQTKVIGLSPPYGIPPVVVHPDMDPALKRDLRVMFLSLHEDPDTRRILRDLHIDRFEEGRDEAYDSIREMQRWVATASVESE